MLRNLARRLAVSYSGQSRHYKWTTSTNAFPPDDSWPLLTDAQWADAEPSIGQISQMRACHKCQTASKKRFSFDCQTSLLSVGKTQRWPHYSSTFTCLYDRYHRYFRYNGYHRRYHTYHKYPRYLSYDRYDWWRRRCPNNQLIDHNSHHGDRETTSTDCVIFLCFLCFVCSSDSFSELAAKRDSILSSFRLTVHKQQLVVSFIRLKIDDDFSMGTVFHRKLTTSSWEETY